MGTRDGIVHEDRDYSDSESDGPRRRSCYGSQWDKAFVLQQEQKAGHAEGRGKSTRLAGERFPSRQSWDSVAACRRRAILMISLLPS